MMMKCLRRVAAILAVALFCLANTPSQAQEKFTAVHGLLQLGISFASESSLPDYLGYWKEEGLQVEVLTSPGVGVGTQLLINRGADALVGSVNAAMKAVHQGVDLKIIYTNRRGDVFGLAFPEGSKVQSVKELKGASVGVTSFASFTTAYIKYIMKKNGLAEDDVNLVEIGVGGRAAAAIKDKQVDAISMFDGAFHNLQEAGIKLTIYKEPDAASLFTGSIVVHGKDIQDPARRKIIVGFARGIAKAHVFEAANPAAAAQIHWKVYPQAAPRGGVTPEAIEKAVKELKVNIGVQSRDAFGTGTYGDMPKDKMQQAVDYLRAMGDLPEEVIDMDRYYTNELIAEITNFDEQAIVEQAKNFKMPK